MLIKLRFAECHLDSLPHTTKPQGARKHAQNVHSDDGCPCSGRIGPPSLLHQLWQRSTLSNEKHDLPLFAANALDSSANEDHLALVALDVNTAW